MFETVDFLENRKTHFIAFQKYSKQKFKRCIKTYKMNQKLKTTRDI